MEKLNLRYLTAQESQKYSFYLIPRLLIDSKYFDSIDYGAKILYSLILSRASLSAKNMDKFSDGEGKLFVIYTVEQIMQDMRCSKPTAIKMLKQLDNIGLVEKKRQGLSKPTIIYIKDFASIDDKIEKDNKSRLPQEVKDIDFKKSNIFTSESKKCLPQEVNTIDFKRSNKLTSRSKDTELQEVNKLNSSYPNNNYPNHSYLESNLILSKDTEKIRQEIKEQINYSFLVETNPTAKEFIESIYEIIVDIMTSNQQYITLGGSKLSLQTIQKRFMQLSEDHIDMVLRNIQNTKTEIKNIKKYLLKCLYDIPLTFETQMDNELRSKGLI